MHRHLILVVLMFLTCAAAMAQSSASCRCFPEIASGTPCPTTANTCTFWVSPTGNDANPCTQAAPCRTIQHAVNLTLEGDGVCVAPGTYAECFSAFFVDGNTGAPVPSGVAILGSDYFSGASPGSSTTVLDATGLDCSVVSNGQTILLPVVELGDQARLCGFTVKGNQGGGGVRGYGAVQITNNTIEGNSALRGGGVYVYTGYYVNVLDDETIVRSNVIRNNLASTGGGVMVRGVAYYGGGGSVSLESNSILNNTASDAAGGYGAGLYVLTDSFAPTDISRVTITQNIVEGNVAVLGTGGGVGYGGGIYASTYGYPAIGSEVIEIVDNVVRDNLAEGYGGGVLAQILGTIGPAGANPGYEVKVEDNSITANTAASGGGGLYVYVQNTDLDGTVKANLAAERNSIVGNVSNGSIPPQFAVPAGGGGVYAEVIQARNTTPNVNVHFDENVIQGNDSATVGGGASLYVFADSEPDPSANVATNAIARFENNLVTGNTSSSVGMTAEGGGVYALAESRGVADASVRLKFNTVADNGVDPGGAAVFVDAATFQDSVLNQGTATMEVSNSILFRNLELELESGFTHGTSGRSLSVKFNDVYDTAGSLYGPTVGNRTGQNGNQSFAPGLSALYVPLLCSPVIDAGDPAEGTRDGAGRLTSEPQPNGGIVNLGHLGNTLSAQRTLPDASGDGIVDGLDLLRIASSFASTSSQAARFNPQADRDRDGDVDGDDLAFVAAFFGQACP